MATDQLRYIERQIEAFVNSKTQDGGKLNRADIADHFSFTELSASKHIQKFIARNPGFLEYDMSRKAYFRADGQPNLINQEASHDNR